MRRWQILVILFSIWIGSSGFTPTDGEVYSNAVEFAEAGRVDFAFMQFNQLLRDYPDSKFREQALFAVGEYYYKISGMDQAEAAFRMFIDEFPESNKKIYALAYLLSVIQKKQNTEVIQDLEKQIIDLQQVSFVFRETKAITYQSPLHQSYKAVIHIDKIEFYVEGKLFAKVSY